MVQNTPLTGPHDTQQLPLITGDPVTVVVERVPIPGMVTEFKTALVALVGEASRADGCLGATVLEGAEPADPYHVVFRFKDAVSLRRWEKSVTRIELVKNLEPFTMDTSVVTAPSPKAWFEANDVPVENGVQKWFRDLLWALPLAFTMALLVTPLWADLPLGIKIVASSAVGIAAYATLIAPLRNRWRKRMISKDPLL